MNFYRAEQLFEKVNDVILKDIKVLAYCVGGLAINYWVGACRQTIDIDVIFSHPLIINDIFF